MDRVYSTVQLLCSVKLNVRIYCTVGDKNGIEGKKLSELNKWSIQYTVQWMIRMELKKGEQN